jgi:hypothetical protein
VDVVYLSGPSSSGEFEEASRGGISRTGIGAEERSENGREWFSVRAVCGAPGERRVKEAQSSGFIRGVIVTNREEFARELLQE